MPKRRFCRVFSAVLLGTVRNPLVVAVALGVAWNFFLGSKALSSLPYLDQLLELLGGE